MSYPKDQDRWMAQWALKCDWITEDQFNECISAQQAMVQNGQEPIDSIDFLLGKQYLSKTQKAAILNAWEKRKDDRSVITCEYCGAEFNSELQKVGKTLKCGQCGKPLKFQPFSSNKMEEGGMGKMVKRTLGFLAMSKRDNLNVPGYKILSRLGEDIVGTTYKAQSRADKKNVVIKLLKQKTIEDQEFMKQIEHSVKLSSSVEVPNVRKNYGILKHEDMVCIVSEFVEGESLYNILKRSTKVSIEKAMKICLRLAKILRYAHENGLVHGDVCPSNVLISDSGKVILSDLGIPSNVAQNAFTIAQTEGIAPLYMAPEVLAEKQTIDHRSDIYSLGALLYHLLANKPPIEGNSPFEVLNRLTEGTPIPPLQIYNMEVPNEICHVIEKMMAADIEDRYQNYDDLIMDLQNPQRVSSTPDEKEVVEEKTVAKEKASAKSKSEAPEEKKEEESLKELTSETKVSGPSPLSDVPWFKIVFAAAILGLIGWKVYDWMDSEKIYQEAEKDWYSLRKYYKDNRHDRNKWDKIEKKMQEYLVRYREVSFPNYEPDRNIKKDVEDLLSKFKFLKERSTISEAQQLANQASNLAKEYKFCAALELLENAPEYLKSEKGAPKIQGARDFVLKEARKRFDHASHLQKEAIQHKKFEKALEEIKKLLENCTQNARSAGEFAKDLEQLKGNYALLKKEEEVATRQKEESERGAFESAYQSLQQKLQQSLVIYDYRSAARLVERWRWPTSKDKELIEEYEQKIAEMRRKMPNLVRAKDIIVHRMNEALNKKQTVKFFFSKKVRGIVKINDRDIQLEGNISLSWKDFPREQFRYIVELIEERTNPQEKLCLSYFCVEHENYSFAYRLLSKISNEQGEARDFITRLESILTQNLEEKIKEAEEKIESSDFLKATESVVSAKEKYILPGKFVEKYDAPLGQLFLKIMNRVYHAGSNKYRFLDFSSPDPLKSEDASSLKFEWEEGCLKISRGSISFDPKDFHLFAGMGRLESNDEKIAVYLSNNNRRIYSLQISGEAKASYGAYHAKGGVKNEGNFQEVRNRWFSFAMFIASGQMHWNLNGQNRFSSIHTDDHAINKIHLQFSSGKSSVVLLDNLYIGFRR